MLFTLLLCCRKVRGSLLGLLATRDWPLTFLATSATIFTSVHWEKKFYSFGNLSFQDWKFKTELCSQRVSWGSILSSCHYISLSGLMIVVRLIGAIIYLHLMLVLLFGFKSVSFTCPCSMLFSPTFFWMFFWVFFIITPVSHLC